MSDYKFNNDATVKDTLVESWVQAGVNVMLSAAQARGIKVSQGKQNSYPVEVKAESEPETIILKTDNANSIEIDAVMDCNTTKNIVSTAINGVGGTVKEWVSDGDVAVTIDVTLLSDNGVYPRERVERLVEMLKRNESLMVSNKTLNEVWGVTRLVVTSWTMRPTPGFDYQQIGINAISDEAYIVEEEILQ